MKRCRIAAGLFLLVGVLIGVLPVGLLFAGAWSFFGVIPLALGLYIALRAVDLWCGQERAYKFFTILSWFIWGTASILFPICLLGVLSAGHGRGTPIPLIGWLYAIGVSIIPSGVLGGLLFWLLKKPSTSS